VEQIRLLRLGVKTGCAVEVWREVRDKKRRKSEWKMIERRIPMRLGKPLPLIPFVLHGPRHSLAHIDMMLLGDVILRDAGVEAKRLPAQSPNLNSHVSYCTPFV
jgi:hypothetical protein